MDIATRIAAFTVLAFGLCCLVVVFALILKTVVYLCNRILPRSSSVAVPTLRKAVGLTLLSVFVYGIFLLACGWLVSQFGDAPAIRVASTLAGLVLGALVMSRIFADVLPSTVRRAFAITLVSTVAQTVFLALTEKQIGLVFGILWEIATS